MNYKTEYRVFKKRGKYYPQHFINSKWVDIDFNGSQWDNHCGRYSHDNALQRLYMFFGALKKARGWIIFKIGSFGNSEYFSFIKTNETKKE